MVTFFILCENICSTYVYSLFRGINVDVGFESGMKLLAKLCLILNILVN